MLGGRLLVLYAVVFSAESQIAGTEFMEKATDDTEETGVECEVLVLGAGMAGIAAASKLTQLGMQDIVVVEGSNRSLVTLKFSFLAEIMAKDLNYALSAGSVVE